MKIRVCAAVQAVIALAVGATVYLLFREETLLHQVLRCPVNQKLATATFWGCDFVRFYFADFLWGYALTLALISVYLRGYGVIVAVAAVGWTYEVLQRWGVVSGTGDIADVFLYLLAAIAAYGNIQILKRRGKS